MCDQIQTSQHGIIEDVYWKKIINKMYDRDDVRTLTQRFMDTILMRKAQQFAGGQQSLMSSIVLKENKNTQ